MIKNTFLNPKNNFLERKDQNYKNNNIGTTFMTGTLIRQAQSQLVKRRVIKDFKNSKLIKSLLKNEDGPFLKGKKQIINRIVSIQNALSCNSPGNIVHGRVLKSPVNFSRTSYRSSSVRASLRKNIKDKKSSMNITSYGNEFLKDSKTKEIDNLNLSQNIPNTTKFRLKTADPHTTLFKPREGKRVATLTAKYHPSKLRPFLDYKLAQLSKLEKNETEKFKSLQPESSKTALKGKGKGKEDLKVEIDSLHLKTVDNILLEDFEEEDTDSERNSPKFKINNIKQEEIDAQMFENPVTKRKKNIVKAK